MQKYDLIMSSGQSQIVGKKYLWIDLADVYTLLDMYLNIEYCRENRYPMPERYCIEDDIPCNPFDGQYHVMNGDYSYMIQIASSGHE